MLRLARPLLSMTIRVGRDKDFQERLAVIQPRLDRIRESIRTQFADSDYFGQDGSPRSRSSSTTRGTAARGEQCLPCPMDGFYLDPKTSAWLLGRVDSLPGKINVYAFGSDFVKKCFILPDDPNAIIVTMDLNESPEGNILYHQNTPFEYWEYSSFMQSNPLPFAILIELFDLKVIYSKLCLCDDKSEPKMIKDFVICSNCLQNAARKCISVWIHKTYAPPNGYGYRMAAKRFKNY